ncbi:carboxyphosphonoenolpyruvate phosphonomutase-like protein [Aspergillus piperis CBS 112811]|uniref:Carboxyphosphonoenolpyruvate phosphonomutase-like protein n=1 Tax=Aspergillus piperis CBS 112811 TaxID=1448313 RepID=A0A8G1QWM9_9EURO|nr:carboxyphosphonoenolpyruvate phosphonomutase-like protein [Aspergillus piperis CBS 112811]RAH52735.1 carboxyphosphonoenolpyruvate phosphonomutase-like protein [Aspergillus piperis CBS 112811]
MSSQNDRAIYFRSLHHPGNPIVLSNVYDGATASYIAGHATTKAIATASYAVAASQGIADESLTLPQNLAAARTIAAVVAATTSPQLPLTVDMQDGYEDVAQTIRDVIALGAVGCNLEDFDNAAGKLRSLPEAVNRIRTAVQAAREAGVPDFVINARTDVLGPAGTGSIEDAIERGKAFLDAGACTVFVWGPGGRGVSGDEVRELAKALGGMVNVKLKLGDGYLTVSELKKIGVARISLGPELWRAAMGAFRETADRLLAQVSYD